MCQMTLSDALNIARLVAEQQSVLGTDLQDAHRTLNTRCGDFEAGMIPRLEGLIGLKEAKITRLLLADELEKQGLPHTSVRPARAAQGVAA